MKRHKAIAALSRDHHHALVVAQRLKRASDTDATGARDAFLEYWRADGQRHFREEEEILLPAYAGFGDPEAPVVARVLVDHVRIRRMAHEIASETPNLEALQTLGEELSAHVRREERELFPLIEQTLPEPELARLVQLLG
ncbi:MAG TPA: hemerythrin domain-containing protein [Solirubrobacteraceae bacterium]|nr:hemerythrin domain-containing protein [Solirubrobacteraceae bacterium]